MDGGFADEEPADEHVQRGVYGEHHRGSDLAGDPAGDGEPDEHGDGEVDECGEDEEAEPLQVVVQPDAPVQHRGEGAAAEEQVGYLGQDPGGDVGARAVVSVVKLPGVHLPIELHLLDEDLRHEAREDHRDEEDADGVEDAGELPVLAVEERR